MTITKASPVMGPRSGAVLTIEQRLLSPVDKGSLEVKAIAVAQSVLMTLRADRVAELSNSAKV
jgi:hypothetical protein